MANVKVRAASLFVGGKKIGHFEGNNYDIASGDEAMFGDPGYSGHSDGATTTKLTANGFVPLAGFDYDFITAMLNKTDLDIGLSVVGGKIHQITMRCTQASIKSTHKTGGMTGDFTFEGGEPRITG